jgi:hypothetical protein
MSTMDTDDNLKGLADVALRKGAQPYANGENVIYDISDEYLEPDAANYCVSVGGEVDDYRIKRYKAVKKLSTKLPASLPGSTVEDDDGIVTALTWKDVQNLATVNVTPISGTYHFDVTAHLSHRGLTLDEYNAASGLTLLSLSELPSLPVETI